MNDANNLLMFLLQQTNYEEAATTIHSFRQRGEEINLARALEELKRLDLLHVKLGRRGQEKFMIKEPVRQRLLNIPKGFEGNPYGYLLAEDNKRTERETEKEWYETENARQIFEDYPRVKRTAVNSNRLSLAAVVIALIALLQQLLCNAPK